jgi:hypothetical protein
MKAAIISTVIATTLLGSIYAAKAADDTAKESAKVEERMKDEKRRDEHQAKDYANRVRVARFDSVWRSPRSRDIDVIQVRESASRPYKAIALLTFDCPAKEETQAVAGFIAKTKDLGADGLVMIGFELPSFQRVDIFNPDERRVFRANAIIYQNPK